MALYASIGSGSGWYKIVGTSLTIIQGTVAYAGASASQWISRVTRASYLLQKHSYLLIWAWKALSRLLNTIALARGALPDKLRTRKFLESFQASFLEGRSALTKIELKRSSPLGCRSPVEVGRSIDQEQIKAAAASWNDYHAVHGTSSMPPIDMTDPLPSRTSLLVTEVASSLPSISENHLPPTWPLTRAASSVSAISALELPARPTSESPELSNSPTSFSTSSITGDGDEKAHALVINHSATETAFRCPMTITSSHTKPPNTAGYMKTGDTSRKGLKKNTSNVSHTFVPSHRSRNNSIHPHTKTTIAPVSVSSGAEVCTSSTQGDVQKQKMPAHHDAISTSRKRSIYHSQDVYDDGEPLASPTAVTSSKILAGSSKDHSKSKNEGQSAAARGKTKDT